MFKDHESFSLRVHDHFINSHNLISWLCLDIVGRNLMLVTTESLTTLRLFLLIVPESWITWGWDVSDRSAHMLLTLSQHSCRHCLKYCSNIWENTPLASRNIAGFYCWHSCEVELKSTLQACLGKYKELGLLLAFCSHIRTVSQWVLAAWCCRKVGDICVITRL